MMLPSIFRLAFGALAIAAISACGNGQPATTASEPVAAEAQAPFESAHFEVTTVGSGTDVILVPGLASHADIWDTTVEQFQDRYRFHLVQVSGFAGAPARGNAGEADVLGAISEDLIAYAASLDSSPAIIGHSLGGLVSLKAGLTNEDAFDRVMVVDVLPFFSVLMDPAATAESMQATGTLMSSVLLMQDEETFRQRQGDALSALTKDPAMAEQSLEWSLQTDRAVMAKAMGEVVVTDLRAQMSGFNVPLTVLYARDPGVPNMEATEALFLNDYAPVPEVDILPVDGALHFVMADQPAAFHAAVETFLDAQ